jgi:hypothetical protein
MRSTIDGAMAASATTMSRTRMLRKAGPAAIAATVGRAMSRPASGETLLESQAYVDFPRPRLHNLE